MRKIYTYIFLLFILIFSTGCYRNIEILTPIPNLPVAVKFRIMKECFHISSQIQYLKEMQEGEKLKDKWQSPSETIKLKTGDCEDQAIYLQWILYQRGVMSEVVFGKMQKTDEMYHAWVQCQIGSLTFVIDPANHVFSDKRFLRPEMYLRYDFNFYFGIISRKPCNFSIGMN